MVYPAPPDTPRVQFLGSITRGSDLGARPSILARAAGVANAGGEIVKPYGVAAAGERVCVCDTRLAGIHMLDLARRTMRPFVPTGPGRLRTPINCAFDGAGRLLVADPGRGDVVVFGPEGGYLGAIAPASDARPTDVVVAGDTVWVLDLENRQVSAWRTADLARILTWPAGGHGGGPADAPGGGRLFSPTNMAAGDTRVYVSDTGGFDVEAFTRGGRWVASIGAMGRAPGQFSRPKGVAVDREGRVYVVDAVFENVQIFDAQGRLLLAVGGPYRGPGDLWLPADVFVHYGGLESFRSSVLEGYTLEHLILVTSQYGPAKLSIYGLIRPE